MKDSEPIHVLLIEDNPGDARLIREMLIDAAATQQGLFEGASFDLESCDRLASGLARLIAGGIGVLLLDLGLPDSQGIDTFARAHTQAPRVPTVVLTGLEDEALGVELVRAGAQDYLVKGRIDGHALARAICYAIERQRTEEALQESEERFRALTQSANEAIIGADSSGRIVLWNKGAERLFLYTEQEALGQPVVILIPEPYLTRHREGVERLHSIGETRVIGKTYEACGLKKDGSEFPVEISLATWEVAKGKSYSAIIRDITERQRAEGEIRDSRDAVLNMLEDLDKTARQVQSSEEQYRTLVENATELIWTHDTEGRFTFTNKQAEQVSGHKLQDWLGKSFAPLIAPPEDLPRIQRIFLKTLAGKAQSYDVGVYRADGSVFYLSVNTAPLYRDGQIVGTISFGRDVTAQREAEAAAQQRMTELTALFEVSSALRGVATADEMLPIILRSTVQVVQCDQGLLSLVDRARGEIVVRVTTPGQESLLGLRTKIGEGVSGRVVQTGRPMLPADLAGLQAPTFIQRVAGNSPRSVICYPLATGTEVVGTFYLSAPLPREFSERDLKLLGAIADMAASAIYRARLFEELEHRVHELSTLFDVGKMVTASLRVEDVLEFIVGAASRAVHAEGCYLFLWTEREQRLVMRAAHGLAPDLVGQVKYRLGEGLAGWVFLEGKPANVPDVAADPRWKREPDQERTHATGRVISALVVPLRVGDKTLGVLGVVNKTGAPAFTASDESLLTALASETAISIENARLYEDVRGLSIATIRSLATAIDARDPYTRGHSDDVAHLSVQLARALGWSGADLEMLEFAGLLHDVGKIAVPDAILRKTEPLTPDDWNIIRLHPYHSAQIVKPVEPLQRIVPWIYHHQEKWDGTGYPDRLKGAAIPLAARIIAVVDAFNAMTTDRPYRRAKTRAEALTELQRCVGIQFDPAVMEAFLQMMK